MKASSNHHLQEMIITLRSKSCTNKNRRAGCYYWDLGRRRIEVDSSRCGLRHGTKCSTNVACAILLSTSLLLRLLPWQKFGLTFMMVWFFIWNAFRWFMPNRRHRQSEVIICAESSLDAPLRKRAILGRTFLKYYFLT